MGIKAGFVGVGSFAQPFIPLFKAHPGVDEVVFCDLDEQKLAENAAKHGVKRTFVGLDAICESDVDAVMIFTQNWLHAPQAVQALRAGKQVYSAVPTGITVDEIADLVLAVEETGRIYMLGETSYYYPAVIYCREQFGKGAFGHVVFSEAQYYHDYDHGLYEVMKSRAGERWKEIAGSPPMHYPTHSTSQIISVTGARMTHVSCQGFVDRHEDGLFRKGVNKWDNVFSNETALFRMSDGSSSRISEYRRIGHPGTVSMSMFGTEGSYESSESGSMWLGKDRKACENVTDMLTCAGPEGMAPVHQVDRLPTTMKGIHSGHSGSHAFLVDDFVTACLTGETPVNNVWEAARYALPGILAHESAERGGELLEVPDFGDGPGPKGNR